MKGPKFGAPSLPITKSPLGVMIRTAASWLPLSSKLGPLTLRGTGVPSSRVTSRSLTSRESWSPASATSRLKSRWICWVVRTPTIAAKPQRMTSVSAAEPPARRQRIGSRLYAEDVSRAADRMEEPRLATGFELPSQVGDEDLDRVGDRERVIAPDLVEQLLARDHQALVAHQVLEQLELALRELDRAIRSRDLVRVG